MINLKSSDVEVYPATRRDSSYLRFSRMFNERNAIAPITHLAENSSFVITNTFDSNSSFEFVIDGYYFKVNPASSLLSNVNSNTLKIFGYIILDNMNNITEISGIDDPTTSLYTGLCIENDNPPSNASASLLLLNRDSTSSGWKIPADSKVRFSRNTINIDIDGGVIS